jgi:hypothetical protein
MASFMGQSFSFDLEITKEKGDDPVTNTYHIKVPYDRDGTVLNLPGLLAGLPEEAYTTEFVPVEPEPSPEDEEIVTEDFGIGESEEESQS